MAVMLTTTVAVLVSLVTAIKMACCAGSPLPQSALQTLCQEHECSITRNLSEQEDGGSRRDVLEVVAIRWGPELPHLKSHTLRGVRTRELRLQYLGIRHIQRAAFSFQQELRVLDLQNNKLTSLPMTVFEGLTQLLVLKLSYNKLTSFPVPALKVLPSLREFEISRNNLQEMDFKDGTIVHQLEKLDISFNMLNSIDKNISKHLPKLQDLQIQGNLLACDCSNDWLRNYANCLCALVSGSCHGNLSAFSLLDYPTQNCPPQTNLTCGGCRTGFVGEPFGPSSGRTGVHGQWGGQPVDTGNGPTTTAAKATHSGAGATGPGSLLAALGVIWTTSI